MTKSQDDIFRDGEADAWYRRNQAALDPAREDRAARLVAGIADRSRLRRVAELGCANGWRLARLAEVLSPECSFTGVDASEAAIAEGRRRFPRLHLARGLLSDVPLDGPFDLVIVHFVLHWIDRGALARCLAEIDRLVATDGYLLLGDFLPDFPCKRAYHHLPGQGVFTYKQDYAQAFLGLGLYRELARVTFEHDRPDAGPEHGWLAPATSDARAAVCLLHKPRDAYAER